MALEYFLALFSCTALFPARAVFANAWYAAVEPFSIPVCCSVPQAVAKRTDQLVMFCIIVVIPGFETVFLCMRTGVRQYRDTGIF